MLDVRKLIEIENTPQFKPMELNDVFQHHDE